MFLFTRIYHGKYTNTGKPRINLLNLDWVANFEI